ncbi:MAG: hypothetical protein ACRDIU_02580 [Actinomycetota bacterium]
MAPLLAALVVRLLEAAVVRLPLAGLRADVLRPRAVLVALPLDAEVLRPAAVVRARPLLVLRLRVVEVLRRLLEPTALERVPVARRVVPRAAAVVRRADGRAVRVEELALRTFLRAPPEVRVEAIHTTSLKGVSLMPLIFPTRKVAFKHNKV